MDIFKLSTTTSFQCGFGVWCWKPRAGWEISVSLSPMFLSLFIPFKVTAVATVARSRAALENKRGASDKLSRRLPLLGFHCAHNKRDPWISLPLSLPHLRSLYLSLSVALSFSLPPIHHSPHCIAPFFHSQNRRTKTKGALEQGNSTGHPGTQCSSRAARQGAKQRRGPSGGGGEKECVCVCVSEGMRVCESCDPKPPNPHLSTHTHK